MLATVWSLQSKLLRTKIEASGILLGGPRPLKAHRRFLRDVLYGLHGFARGDPCSSLPETSQKNTFSHAAQDLSPILQKTVLEPSKSDSKTLLSDLWIHPESDSETEYLKKLFFALSTPRGICCLRAPDPGNGTTITYRYIHVYMYIYIFWQFFIFEFSLI